MTHSKSCSTLSDRLSKLDECFDASVRDDDDDIAGVEDVQKLRRLREESLLAAAIFRESREN